MKQTHPAPGSNSSEGLDWQGIARTAASSLVGEGGRDIGEMLRELLVFGLEGSAYAIPVERVREIVRMKNLTCVPRSPVWLLGVVALRGEVVEVVDLRVLLGLAAAPVTRSSRIILLHGDIDRVTGVLVDSVSEVFRVSEDLILPAQGLDFASVVEMCRRDDEFVSILDVDRALGVSDV